MNSDGTGIVRLTPGQHGIERFPPGLRMGKKIAFTSIRDGSQEIWVMNADGSNQRRITQGLDKCWGPQWSPDGSKILFYSGADGSAGNIYVVKPDGTGLVQLTKSGKDRVPQWSPDGKMILFDSRRDGPLQVLLMMADGTHVTYLTGTSTNQYPQVAAERATQSGGSGQHTDSHADASTRFTGQATHRPAIAGIERLLEPG